MGLKFKYYFIILSSKEFLVDFDFGYLFSLESHKKMDSIKINCKWDIRKIWI